MNRAIRLGLVSVVASAVLTASPLGLAAGQKGQASFPSYSVSFRYPAAWKRIDCAGQHTTYIRTVTYLTTRHPGSCPSGLLPPVKSLGPDGVLVWWWSWGFPGKNPIGNFPGRPLMVGGQAARIATVAVPTNGAGTVAMPKEICSRIGGKRLIQVAIKRPAPATRHLLMVTACLRGPKLAASHAAARKMLTSVTFGK